VHGKRDSGKALPLALLTLAGGCAGLLAAGAQPHQAFAASADARDASVQPGDDFFAYANEEWLKHTEIPQGRSRWGARNEIDEKTRGQLAAVIIDAAAAPPGSYARKVSDFYAAYLAEGAVEDKGLAPLKPLLDRITELQDKAQLSRFLGSELRADVDPLNFGVFTSSHVFGLSIERGLKGEPNDLVYLLQGGLALPDRDDYLKDTPAMQSLREHYRGYIGRVLKLLGLDRAAQRAAAVMALETAIAQGHATREASSDNRNIENHWTPADFSVKAPGMDWGAFFAAAQLSRQGMFVVWQPGAVTAEAALVSSRPLGVWKDYLRVHAIDRYAEVLPRAFAGPARALHALGDPTPTSASREQRAMDALNGALPDAVGRLYVDAYFSPQSKAKLQAIVANVVEAFEKRTAAVGWMASATKAQALFKLKHMYFGVGYPETWPDYAGLVIDANDAVGNLERVADWNYRNALARLNQPAPMSRWVTPPQAVAAYLIPQQNAYNFAAALLQVPKFDPTASDATNYGAIGAIVGHEVSHFVDPLGADTDAQGALHHWWTSDDRARFDQVSAALAKQFSAYRPFPDLPVDGTLTLSENIADLGGLEAAFDAYRWNLGERRNDQDYVRRQDRQFFLGFARAWRVKLRDDALRTQLRSNDHAPEMFRVSTVRNLDAWYDAFDVMPSQSLYLEPEARVHVW
jgi:predicted metalloendopeptidase